MTFDKSKRRGWAGLGLCALAPLAPLVLAACAPGEPRTGAAEQAAVTPLPSNLSLVLNARNRLTFSAAANVTGDVGASGPTGSVLFGAGATQGYSYYSGGRVLGNTVEIEGGATVGYVYGNDLIVEGTAAYQYLGLDLGAVPQVPAGATADPGQTKVSVGSGHLKQLCPGRYGTISVGTNGRLNLNGGVYHVNRLILSAGARLEPSEPVVIVVGGNLSVGDGAIIRPYSPTLTPMSADDIRIEVGGDATLGEDSDVRAHILAPNGELTTGQNSKLTGAGWAADITIGVASKIVGQDAFDTETPDVPPPCNDNSVCTTDTCVGGDTASGYCSNTPLPVDTSCEDGVFCNGEEKCNATGQCRPGTARSAGTSCADGNACNGAETCNGYGTCVNGTPPVISDSNACTADSCDPATGVEHEPLPDGTTCYGSGVCQEGACSIEGAVFSEDFVQYETPYAQCTSWNTFRSALTGSSYNSITMSGTFAPLGVTCNDPTRATQICQALRTGSSASVSCNGRVWNVGNCGNGVELSASHGICQCSYSGAGYTARPCGGYYDWGGVGTPTCYYAPDQNITIHCE